jgi:5,10-methylenetetrahydrofolate reductase
LKITELFKRGEFVVTAEVGPPKGFHIDHLIEEAKEYLKGRVHAVNVTDNQSSIMRLGSLATCKVLKDNGFNSIFQITCRDRNRIALQSDILSAALFGIENLLLLTGDHTTLGDNPQAKPVFDLDSVSLIHMVKKLESGEDLAGNALDGEPPKFAKGAVVFPPAATRWTSSLPKWRKK